MQNKARNIVCAIYIYIVKCQTKDKLIKILQKKQKGIETTTNMVAG